MRAFDPPDIDIDFPWDERTGSSITFSKYSFLAAMISNHMGSPVRHQGSAKVYGRTEIKAVTQRMGYYWSLRHLEDMVIPSRL
jgi:error-prone DNA polymerase